jgi:ABC-type branched-subunit amino acid transport system substrate-binding protein
MAVAGVAAGCGSDDGGGGGSTATKQSFSGSPVTLYFSGPLKTPIADTSDAAAAVKAAARKINEDGGLRGHELVVKTCNDTDANAELQCARKAAREGALAFVGSAFIFNPKASQDALAQQRVASVAPLAIQMVEYSSPINFPLQTTSFGILACPQQMAQAVGAKRVSAIAQDLPVQKELLKTVQGVSAVGGIPYGKNVTIPVSQTDLSSAVRELADSKADTVVNVLAPTAQPSVGQKFKFCSAPSNYTTAVVKQLGAAANDVYVSIGLPPVGEKGATKYPLIQQFRKEMQAARDAGDKDADLGQLRAQPNALNAWLGVQVIKQVAADVKGALTSKTLLAALNKAKVDLGNLTPPLDFSKPVPVKTVSRLFNPVVNLYKWDAGTGEWTKVDAAKPVNVLETFAALQKAGA